MLEVVVGEVEALSVVEAPELMLYAGAVRQWDVHDNQFELTEVGVPRSKPGGGRGTDAFSLSAEVERNPDAAVDVVSPCEDVAAWWRSHS